MRCAIMAVLALAGCGNAPGKIDSVRAGQTVKVVGDQGILIIDGKTWKPAITIDASAARFTGIVIKNTTGLRLVGGLIVGSGTKGYGINIRQANNVTVEDMTITRAYRGIVIGQSQDIAIRNNQLTGLISDGIDIAASQRVLVERNSCSNFTPTEARIDAAGAVISGDHPDCIQGWSQNGRPPTADISVIGNRAEGSMQGIFFRDTGKNGGFDRIIIQNNQMRTARSNAIFVEGARGAMIRGNRVSSVPGAVQLRTGRPVRAIIVFKESTGTLCGNQVADSPGHIYSRPC